MKHRETKQSVLIRTGLYSSTIFELEVWTLANDSGFQTKNLKNKSSVPAVWIADSGERWWGCSLPKIAHWNIWK